MTPDLSYIAIAVAEHGHSAESAVPILQAIQEHYGYLPCEALERVCELTEITPSQVAGVASFYSQFRHQPVGKHMISVCDGTACHVKGSPAVYEAFRRQLGLAGEADTDAEGLFTLRKVACLGCCTLAPAVQIDEVTYGHMTPQATAGVLRDFLGGRKKPSVRPPAPSLGDGTILIGLGSCCVARGSGKVEQALVEALHRAGASASVKCVGCVGMCHQTPLVEVQSRDSAPAFYARVREADAQEIVARHFGTRGLARRMARAAAAATRWLLEGESQPAQTLDHGAGGSLCLPGTADPHRHRTRRGDLPDGP